MRKPVALLVGLCLALSIGALNAHADTCWPHWRSLDLKLRNSVNNSQGYRDSNYFQQGTFRAETTESVPTLRWQRDNLNGQAASTADSVDLVTLHVNPRTVSGLTAGGDSIYVFAQVSMDGKNWSNMTPTRSFQSALTLTTGASVLEATSDLNSFTLPFKQSFTEAGGWSRAVEGTAPSTLQFFGWRFARWIIYGDETGGFDVSLDFVSRECND